MKALPPAAARHFLDAARYEDVHHDATFDEAPDELRFVSAAEYADIFLRWHKAERRADNNGLIAAIGWIIAAFLAVDMILRWSGAPW